MYPPKPLVVRAGLNRTFGSLAAFAALGLLALGSYLLMDAFAHPVNAEAAGLLVAAIAIALAILLFFFLLKPRRSPEVPQNDAPEQAAGRRAKVAFHAASATIRQHDSRMDLPYQRAYVDRSRIRR